MTHCSKFFSCPRASSNDYKFCGIQTMQTRISRIHNILNNVLYNMHYDATGNYLIYFLIDFDNYPNSFTTDL